MYSDYMFNEYRRKKYKEAIRREKEERRNDRIVRKAEASQKFDKRFMGHYK